MKRPAPALLGSLALGLLGLYLLAGQADFQARTYHLPTLGLPLALLIAGASAAYWIVPALPLRTLSAVQGNPLTPGAGLLIHLAGPFSAAITPGGSGSAPAIAAGLRRAGVPFGRGVGVALQVNVLDLVFFAWALPLSLAYLLAIEVAVGYGVDAVVAHVDLATPLLLWRFSTFYLVFLLGPLAGWLLIAGDFGRRSPGRRSEPHPEALHDAS